MSTNFAIRVAISASLIWTLAVTTVAAFDYLPGLPASGVFLISVERQRTPEELAMRTGKERKADDVFGPPRESRFNVASYRNWLLLPLGVFWVVGPAIYLLLRWAAAARTR